MYSNCSTNYQIEDEKAGLKNQFQSFIAVLLKTYYYDIPLFDIAATSLLMFAPNPPICNYFNKKILECQDKNYKFYNWIEYEKKYYDRISNNHL